MKKYTKEGKNNKKRKRELFLGGRSFFGVWKTKRGVMLKGVETSYEPKGEGDDHAKKKEHSSHSLPVWMVQK